LLSERDLPLRLIEERAFIDYLGPQDEPWLRVLLAEMARFEGRRRRELAERLAEPLPCEAPHFKRRAASRALLALWRREPGEQTRPPRPAPGSSLPRPAALRQELFGAAAVADAAAPAILDAAGARLGLTREAVLELLFADLPGERPVRAPAPPPTPAEAMLRTNLAIAQAVLMRASRLELRVEGGVRPIVRLAKLRGLLCTILDVPDLGRPMLEISGPFSLFQHTLLYGRALAELLPHLAWCARFELRAACALRGRLATVCVDSGDPIFPATPPALYDSRLEERFAADIARLAPDWDLVREPDALRAAGTLIFPDFLLRHRLHARRQVLIEIVGFWTPEYLASKVEKLRQTDALCLLCVDEDRACATADLPSHLPVIRFRRRIDAAAVLREVERLTQDQSSHAA
jgi:predicted nuclease of restriction endonuclease-like RecB superfamily